ncbi:hypothetical protein E8E13_009318 [Curvularia kusanoi]|uniref:Uncharacterized protein n=1 Tax=Curvularia kusanoi TaxID=90978 RepID=A0A9P4TFQ4_CURKU|nr:hypothetical protein E8E13_009318 [Curvularia kusanoi]
MSRLPRKSIPTQSAFSKSYTYGDRSMIPHAGVSSTRSDQSLIAVSTPPNSGTTAVSPALSCNKPLPSPPFAQIVNSSSPPKAHRTLVDAEAGSPTCDEWPVLHPDNVTPSKPTVMQRDTALPPRSVSEGSALGRPAIRALQSGSAARSLGEGCLPSPVSGPPTKDNDADHNRCEPTMESHTVESEEPSPKTFHAFSNDTEAAMDSSLVEEPEMSAIAIIPPRTSSKRNSFVPADPAIGEVPKRTLSASLRPVRPGSTVWPLLEATADTIIIGNTSDEQVTDEHEVATESRDDGRVSMEMDDTRTERSYRSSIDSASAWSLAAGSSLNDEPAEPGVHYEDADAVIFGSDPPVPTIPYRMSQSFTRSLTSIVERVPSKAQLKMTSSVSSRAPTSSSAEVSEINAVKILPIRSMQPPRRPSTGNLSRNDASLHAFTSSGSLQEYDEEYDEPMPSKNPSSSSLKTSRGRLAAKFKSEIVPPVPKAALEVNYDFDQFPRPPRENVPLKAQKVLGQEFETNQSSSQKHRPSTMMTPQPVSGTLEHSTIIVRSKTSPLLPTIEHDGGTSDFSSDPRSPADSHASQSTPPGTNSHQQGASKLEVPAPEAQDISYPRYKNADSQPAERSIENMSLRVKAKRSFRNIFHRRRSTKKSPPDEKQESKRSSITGSVLAQRMMKSANLSKISIVRQPEAKSEPKEDLITAAEVTEVLERETGRQAALSALESVSAEVPPSGIHQYDTAAVIHKILDHVVSMKEESPDRLRGVEIAEAVLHAAECSKAAQTSAELAKRHAADADLNARRVWADLKRLKELCEPGFDTETMQAIQRLFLVAMTTGTSDEKGEPLED